ncbi:MAG: hypothetical protein JO316_15180 [Abitibacteriaceae bacterium]|nr:hypothetical protein [Abditibacteriaceae bacterium]MBV9866695.1 hypothetical protein [Abditibacteriaceae bacterium]
MQPPGHYSMMRFLIPYLLLIIPFTLFTIEAQSATPLQPQSRGSIWAPQEFPISFWCAPPDEFTTVERYREIKAAGFTYVMPPCGGAAAPERNRKILEVCAVVGLKAFIQDSRLPTSIGGNAAAKAQIDAVIRDYQGYAALAGYFLGDEPGARAFTGLGEVVDYLRQHDPQHYTYLNLLPNYATAGQLGVPTYEQYVQQFAEQVQPFVLSYDHYHFTTGGDRGLFFSNLAAMREASARFHLPFWQIVLCVQHGPYRNLTERELRYEAMQTLVYGGKGLMWFTYWQPNDPSFNWAHAMIDVKGIPDPHYTMVQRINGEVQAIGTELLKAHPTYIFHSGTLPPGGVRRAPGTPLDVIGPGNLTVGIFQDAAGHNLALVTNGDYQHEVTTQVAVPVKKKNLRLFDVPTRQWKRLATATTQHDSTTDVTLHLPPSGAVLLRWPVH